MEKLKKYLAGQSQASFAKEVGISPAYLCQILKGNRTNMRMEIALRIEQATSGAVKMQDLVQ